MIKDIGRFIVRMFLSNIRIVFDRSEAEAFVRGDKVPFLFNCADREMKVSVRRLFEKIAELQSAYLRVSIARPDLELDISAFSGDKEAFKNEAAQAAGQLGFRLVVVTDRGVRTVLFSTQ